MAPPTGTLRVGRYFLALAILLAVLFSIVAFGKQHTPKLGIDLIGGTQVTFTARTQNGAVPSQSSMSEARQIIADRVNGTGVTQATVVIQGNNQLVVSIPGHDANDIAKLGAAAVLNFRGVVTAPVPVTCGRTAGSTGTGTGSGASSSPSSSPSASPSSSASTSPSGSTSSSAGAAAKSQPSSVHSGAAAAVRPLEAAPSTTSSAKRSTSPASTASTPATTSPSSSAPATAGSTAAAAQRQPCRSDVMTLASRAGKFAVPLDDTSYGKLSQTNQQLVNAALANFDCASAGSEQDPVNSYYVACADGSEAGGNPGTNYAFLLGPVIVRGTQIDTATAVAPSVGQQGGSTQWTVSLELKSKGSSSWANYTTAHNVNNNQNAGAVAQCSATGTACANYVGFTLDGTVINAPVNLSAINGLPTQISGSFTADSAKDLANKLKYGALPLSFTPQNQVNVSATLGSSQLRAGLIAGGIGLVLVVIYSLIYYRALGLVTIASLLVSGGLVYGSLVLLGTQIGFTLSLAGIAGFIVAVGITADSFVVFFERIKDEVHEGRSVRVAVPRAWVRARRTILSADTVSFLAAAVLYYFTTDEVRGFAFTLGLSTILDLIVVFLFTHPLVSLLSRSRAFGSARFTGLDALRGNATRLEPGERVRTSRPRPARRGGVAVLDDVDTDIDTDIDIDTDSDDAEAEVEDAEPSDSIEPDTPTTGDPLEPDEPPRERRRTAPQAGSAAERAAARRARMREQREKGES